MKRFKFVPYILLLFAFSAVSRIAVADQYFTAGTYRFSVADGLYSTTWIGQARPTVGLYSPGEYFHDQVNNTWWRNQAVVLYGPGLATPDGHFIATERQTYSGPEATPTFTLGRYALNGNLHSDPGQVTISERLRFTWTLNTETYTWFDWSSPDGWVWDGYGYWVPRPDGAPTDFWEKPNTLFWWYGGGFNCCLYGTADGGQAFTDDLYSGPTYKTGVYSYFHENGEYGTLTISAAAPVPEPETYAMMLAGLGLLGVVARRRKQKLSA